jgi:hypothetical protein
MINFKPYLINPETKTIEQIETFYNGKTDCSIRDQFLRAIGAKQGETIHNIGFARHVLYVAWDKTDNHFFQIAGHMLSGKAIVLAWEYCNIGKQVVNPTVSIERLKRAVSFNA